MRVSVQSTRPLGRLLPFASDTVHLSSLFSGQFAESQGEIKFPEISAKVLEKTVQYFYYKLKYTNHTGPLPEFKIEPEHALELLMAANFLAQAKRLLKRP